MSYGKWFHPIDCEPGVGISGVDTGRPYFTWVLYVTENILSTNTINKFLSRKFPLNPFIFICMHYRALVSVACTCGHQRAPCVHLRALACTSVHLACSRVHLACSGARVTLAWHVHCLEWLLFPQFPDVRLVVDLFHFFLQDTIELLYAILHNTGSRGVACVINWLERRGTSVKFTRFDIAAKT